MEKAIAAWIAKGQNAESARMMAVLYGMPKKSDPFLDKWNIHPSDWQKAKGKAAVKAIVKALNDKITHIYISGAYGSVYIDTADGLTVRVADHERTSNEHARPDHNVFDRASLKTTLSSL